MCFAQADAIAVIGGLLLSTLLSLLFVPALFTIMDDVGYLSGRLFGRFIGPADEAKPAHPVPVPMDAKEVGEGAQREPREKEDAPAFTEVTKPARIA